MLISTLRFYQRILLGLHSGDEEIKGYAEGCMSYLVRYLRHRQITLPAHVVSMLGHLPEVD